MKCSLENRPAAFCANEHTLAEIVHRRATTEADSIAYTFLADGAADARSLTWSQLDQRASALACSLRERGAAGQTVLLALPSGLAFIESLFACWYAGAIAVPISLPRHKRVKHRLDRIIDDAGARLAISTQDARQLLAAGAADGPAIANLAWIDAEAPASASMAAARQLAEAAVVHAGGTGPALLQYTSGSTGAPRGVIVTHANLLRNSALIAEACGHRSGDTIAGWLPLFHDMGLIGLVLQAAFAGARCVFMSPERFLMRPWLWLQMITHYKACSSPAPNFAYEMCIDKVDEACKRSLDLSCWQNALNGAEPVRASTLDRFVAAFAPCGFRRSAFFPCYGLAESTLFVTGPETARSFARRSAQGALLGDEDAGGFVGCGRPFGDTQIAIVDPHPHASAARPVAAGAIGEIWVAGRSVAAGYWNNPEATALAFGARLEDDTENVENRLAWLRTGDLGFMVEGELFITGRLRDLIIIAGRNRFPVDLEQTAESADPAIAAFGVAAFSLDIDGIERLIVVAEVRRDLARGAMSPSDIEAVRRRVRSAIAVEHDVTAQNIVLLCPGALPRTTSGKISRRHTRDAYLSQTLKLLAGLSHDHALL